MSLEAKFQIGKNKITDGLINSINLALKTHKQARISVLKSAAREREEIKKMAEELCQKLSVKCTNRIIGFTIILRKIR